VGFEQKSKGEDLVLEISDDITTCFQDGDRIADQRSIRVLEFNKIVDMVATRTETGLGRERALLCFPAIAPQEVARKQRETTEARHIIIRSSRVPFGGILNIRDSVLKAKRGGTLSPEEFLDIASTIVGAMTLKKFLLSMDEDFYLIRQMARNIGSFPTVEEEILKCIDENAQVKDEASRKLSQIRNDMRRLQSRIREHLESIIRSSHYQTILQEPIITTRNHRYVVPVKQEYKGRFKGIVHDESASGATLFMEPMATVDMNNKVKVLESQEKDEVYRILRELSEMIQEISEELEETLFILAELDFIFARAKLSLDQDACEPIFNQENYIELHGARHPILGKNAVPIDIQLGKDFDLLILTGPNTGGKTVSLKTTGLLVLMAQAGLHIPAKSGSEMPIFKRVLADIGDEQSIEQSLSTFSSHMKQIIQILEVAGEGDLVLLDELGAGTDPTEGAALAMAILEYLGRRGVRVIATTHYSELKTFGYLNERVENASVEFDVETLSPTYKLIIGVPGRSNAFIISRRLGMPEEVVQRATSYLTQDELRVEELIKRIEENRQATEDARREAEAAKIRAGQIEAEYRERLRKLQEEKDAILLSARREARELLDDGRRLIDDTIGQLRKSLPGEAGEKAKEAREALRGYAQEMDELLAPDEEDLCPIDEELASRLMPGSSVLLRKLNQRGVVLQRPDESGQVLVQVGILKVNMPLSDLELVEEKKVLPEKSNISALTRSKSVHISPEIMLRGMTVDEALTALDKYLDDAYLAGLEKVRIIHGKGTGTLRVAISQYLNGHRYVCDFNLGGQGQGGTGVTVATLRK
jgi:DNA mismatch repair protein MutS2